MNVAPVAKAVSACAPPDATGLGTTSKEAWAEEADFEDCEDGLDGDDWRDEDDWEGADDDYDHEGSDPGESSDEEVRDWDDWGDDWALAGAGGDKPPGDDGFGNICIGAPPDTIKPDRNWKVIESDVYKDKDLALIKCPALPHDAAGWREFWNLLRVQLTSIDRSSNDILFH